VGNLAHDADAVACFARCVAARAVAELLNDSKGVAHRLVGFFAGKIDDRANTAGIMFKPRIIQAFRGVLILPLTSVILSDNKEKHREIPDIRNTLALWLGKL
jgi:hypothetical protein